MYKFDDVHRALEHFPRTHTDPKMCPNFCTLFRILKRISSRLGFCEP